MSLRVLILGVNGFIGSCLTEQILKQKDWEVFGMDMSCDKLEQCLGHKRFHFVEGDITLHREWIASHVKKCDVVLPLVAIATPATYVKDPIRVFELDFEANLQIIRQCVRYKKRVLFPSTSEVYGMSEDAEFDEEETHLVLGPIHKQRWIYACSKQLLDRVIYAYGVQKGLQYTLFRPFNWIGPKLDNILEPKEGSSRVVTQFIGNILRGRDIQLVDGGTQRRSFLFIDDGIDALLRMIENRAGCANGRIFNLGNPSNDVSIRELAEILVTLVKTYPKYARLADHVKLVTVKSEEYYGKGYQDILTRVPSIKNAEQYLSWKPTTDLETALRHTLDYHLARPSVELVTHPQAASPAVPETLLAIKVDVDTDRGTRIGVPNLLELFDEMEIRATFLFSLGPDHTGRAVKRLFRRGFFSKVMRTNAVHLYGVRTLLNGVLWPGPHIGRRNETIMRAVRDRGHEVGIHGYDHVRWQDGLHKMNQLEVEAEFEKARCEFERIFHEPAKVAGAAGWQANAHSLAAYDAMGLLYASDARGVHPFFPRVNGQLFKTLQIPTTLPTMDELLGRSECSEDYLVEHYLSLLQSKTSNVLTIHAEIEGMQKLAWFRNFLEATRERAVRLIMLEDLAHRVLKDPTAIPVCDLVKGNVEGRSGTLVLQLT